MKTFEITCDTAIIQCGIDPALPLPSRSPSDPPGTRGVPSAARSPRRSRGSADTCWEPCWEFLPYLWNTGSPPGLSCLSRLPGCRERDRNRSQPTCLGLDPAGTEAQESLGSDTPRQWTSLAVFGWFNKWRLAIFHPAGPSPHACKSAHTEVYFSFGRELEEYKFVSVLLLFTTGHNFHLLFVLSFKTNDTLLFQLSVSLSPVFLWEMAALFQGMMQEGTQEKKCGECPRLVADPAPCKQTTAPAGSGQGKVVLNSFSIICRCGNKAEKVKAFLTHQKAKK